jgi:16S rRNA (adenine1518-N6/adenine1519-N6)-dimethyltransferase
VSALLGLAEIRALADDLGLRPTKTLGQNFVHDPNTVRRIVRAARLSAGERVLEVGPGLGSLTLALLEGGHPVTAVEIDPLLAGALPQTVQRRLAGAELTVITADALRLDRVPAPTVSAVAAAKQTPAEIAPTALVANLPYNVAVPVVLHLLATVPSLQRGLVMVQAEVADRLVAAPGSRTYGVPSVKTAWYAQATRAGAVPRAVFWPVPNVDSGLIRLQRRPPPQLPPGVTRADVFAVIDAAFGQRRKMLRSALAAWAGSPAAAERVLAAAGVDPRARGETLDVAAFARIATAAR